MVVLHVCIYTHTHRLYLCIKQYYSKQPAAVKEEIITADTFMRGGKRSTMDP